MSALDFLRHSGPAGVVRRRDGASPLAAPARGPGRWPRAGRTCCSRTGASTPGSCGSSSRRASSWRSTTAAPGSGSRPSCSPASACAGTLPLPRISTFPELNVRTLRDGRRQAGDLVLQPRRRQPGRGRGGAADVQAAVLPRPRCRPSGAAASVGYLSARRDAARPFVFEAEYRGDGRKPAAPQPGTLEHFLTERYCLYAARRQWPPPGRDPPHLRGRSVRPRCGST